MLSPALPIIPPQNAVARVIADLEHCTAKLKDEKDSPYEVRRLFRDFVTMSQQITEMMRREFSARTGGTQWQASAFQGWDATSHLFKVLRRTDFHETPFVIGVHDVLTFNTADVFGTQEKLGTIQQIGTWLMADPNATEIPAPVTVSVGMPGTGIVASTPLTPIAREFRYFVLPGTVEISEALTAAGTQDVHLLVARCIVILRDYVVFFQSRCAAWPSKTS